MAASSSTSRNEATHAQTTPSAARHDQPAWRVTPAPSGRGAPPRRRFPLWPLVLGALAGRAAEELVYGDITTGAESDIQQLTEIARQMVGRWGMSDAIGPVAVLPTNGHGPLLPPMDEISEHTHRVVDAEVRRIVEAAYDEVSALLREHRDQLDALAHRLMERETLDEADAYAAAGIDHPDSEGALPSRGKE